MIEKEVIVIRESKTHIDDLFRNIRNAFAHASFSIKKQKNVEDYFYFFESRKKGKEIKTRLVLKETTLLRWISYFN